VRAEDEPLYTVVAWRRECSTVWLDYFNECNTKIPEALYTYRYVSKLVLWSTVGNALTTATTANDFVSTRIKQLISHDVVEQQQRRP